MKKFTLPFLTVFTLFLLVLSCRKTDQPTDESQTATPTDSQRFFSVPASATPEAKAVAAAIKKQNERFAFLPSVISKAGYPVWDKAKVVNFAARTVSGRTTGDMPLEVIYIPLVRDSQRRTGAILAAQFFENDTTYRILYDSRYRDFGYDTSGHTQWNARNVFHLFALFDNTIFGYTKFIIKDDSLYKRKDDSTNVVLSFARTDGDDGRTASFSQITVCNTFNHCDIYLDPEGGGCHCVRGNGSVECYTVEICTDYYYDWGGGGGGTTGGDGGWGGTGDGSGGGGGGNDGWWNSDPCSGSGRSSQAAPNGCGPGWSPILPDEDDDNGPLPLYIFNDLSKHCLRTALSKISGGTANTFFRQIYNTFDTSSIKHLIINESDLTNLTAYGYATPPLTTPSGVACVITMDTVTLIRCSQEWMAYVFVHEIAHSAMMVNIIQWDTTNSQHTAMAGQFLTLMAHSLTAAYPSLSEFDAYAMCFAGFYNGIEGNPTPEDIAFSSLIRKKINQKFGLAYTNIQLANLGRQFAESGTKGLRGTCN